MAQQQADSSMPRHADSRKQRPNIILLMSDDQGWGETGYYGHPILKTPHLDEMASQGLRMDRFYAGSPVCSPTRASVLTGRSNDRTAVLSVGHPLRKQEITIARVLKEAGYRTAHFGKWHLNGIKGPGVPIPETDARHPGHFGYMDWLATTNFFDMDPMLSRNGTFESFSGGSSTVLIEEAVKYMAALKDRDQPFFMTVWFGSPHDPWRASEADRKAFDGMDIEAAHHYGELVELDRSIGQLRKALRDMGIADNTLLWFNSDNGGVKYFGTSTTAGLRGFKGDVYEGGLRVPCIIEWPAVIRKPRISNFPSVTMDIFPTLADIAGLPIRDSTYPMDGISIRGEFTGPMNDRYKPIPFRYQGKAAYLENKYKLLTRNHRNGEFELYDLEKDPYEKTDLMDKEPVVAQRMIAAFRDWSKSVDKSIAGSDHLGGLQEPDPSPRLWLTAPEYRPYLEMLLKRPEYKGMKMQDE
jgi:arylsulfatase A-like enzyme